jgi:hypothetical protein
MDSSPNIGGTPTYARGGRRRLQKQFNKETIQLSSILSRKYFYVDFCYRETLVFAFVYVFGSTYSLSLP